MERANVLNDAQVGSTWCSLGRENEGWGHIVQFGMRKNGLGAHSALRHEGKWELGAHSVAWETGMRTGSTWCSSGEEKASLKNKVMLRIREIGLGGERAGCE